MDSRELRVRGEGPCRALGRDLRKRSPIPGHPPPAAPCTEGSRSRAAPGLGPSRCCPAATGPIDPGIPLFASAIASWDRSRRAYHVPEDHDRLVQLGHDAGQERPRVACRRTDHNQPGVRVTRRLLNGQQQQLGQEEADFYPVAEAEGVRSAGWRRDRRPVRAYLF
jgi:hypothetical protein